MRFKDEKCENCKYLCTKKEILEIFKPTPTTQKEIENILDLNADQGDRCIRFPDYIETSKNLWCGEWKMLIGTIPKGQDTLFSFKDRQAYNRFNTLCQKAGIGPRPFHALRATCIKFCQAGGWSPEQVSELTGDTIEVIQAHYATPSQGEMSEVMKNKEVC